MTQPNSISFDDVLGLLRGALVNEFEANYVANRGYTVSDDWGDNLKLTKELAFASATRAFIEDVFITRAYLLSRFLDGLLAAPDDGEEWPKGDEPDELTQPFETDEPVRLGRGFSITAACSIWL